MTAPTFPLRFVPQFYPMLWGGERLPGFVRTPTELSGPIGEAWMLSDVPGKESLVAGGPLDGVSLRDVLKRYPEEVLGDFIPADGRFPLLLKFLDTRRELSVQVHPNDEQAARLHGAGHRGKTEAWVILDADEKTSQLYSGFRSGVTEKDFRKAIVAGTVPETLHAFTPKPGDCLFLQAGTVHAIGRDLLLFELQQTSDLTYRLYDWDRIDANTGKPRELHLERGLECSNFHAGPCDPVEPDWDSDEEAEYLVSCGYFELSRISKSVPFTLGFEGVCTAVAVVSGRGTLAGEPIQTGDVLLLPSVLGAADVIPEGELTILEMGY